MNSIQTDRKLPSLEQYGGMLRQIGTKAVPGSAGTLWIQHEIMSMMRMPVFELENPSPSEIQRILWKGPAAVITYLLEADDRHPANAFLYVCSDREYALDKLSPPMRRNVKRGLNDLRIVPLSIEEVIAYGYPGYRDWLQRVGLETASAEQFRRHMNWRASCPAHVFLGAWRGNRLASFMSMTELDEWVEIDGCFSIKELLQHRPNDALFFHALSTYMSNASCRAVSYGVSSLQAVSNKDGLHAFKTKVGFEARPVHRMFALHPLIRPLANRMTLWGVQALLRLSPSRRQLKKAEGMLAYLLGQQRFSQTQH